MTTVKLKLGWLVDRMPAVISNYREKMTYASHIRKESSGIFSKEVRFPFSHEETIDYWTNHMVKCHPWNQLNGIFNIMTYCDRGVEIQLDCNLYGMILAVTKG